MSTSAKHLLVNSAYQYLIMTNPLQLITTAPPCHRLDDPVNTPLIPRIVNDLSKMNNLKIKKCFVVSFTEIINNSNKSYMRLLLNMVFELEDKYQAALSLAIFDFLLKIYSFIELEVLFI